MAGAEDFGAFESNFLDSMLEVEMTEEDGEVKISQNDDYFPVNEMEFPPVPRFDLQSETLTYKNPYGNSILPVKQTSILKSNVQMPGPSFPLPMIQPSPMIVIHSNLLNSNNVTIKPSIAGNAVPSISGKPTPTPKSTVTKAGRGNKFLLEVFKPDFVKKVYTKKENLPDVSVIGEEEEAFYKTAFQDVSKVQLYRLHCTICDKHIGCGKGIEKKISVHSMLKVLTCKVCSEFYGDGNFPCDEGDHCEIYCRWCGQGGALICCSYCPKVFCKRCVRRNYTQSYVRAVEKSSEWACFVCAQKPLWPHRAVCRALMEYMKLKKTDAKAPAKDTSKCCKPQVTSKKMASEVDKNKVPLSGGQTVQMKAKNSGSTAQSGGKTRAPANITKAASANAPVIVKNFSTALKVNSQTKSPVAVMNKPKIVPIRPKIASTSSSRAIASKPINPVPAPKPINPVPASKPINPVPASKPIHPVPASKPINPVPAERQISGANIPSVLSNPIYHGQTFATFPRVNAAQNKPPIIQNEETTESVEVSVTDSVNVDLSKIPVAVIPPNVQEVILRLNFPNNKVQLVRVVREGSPNEEDIPFPIPKFKSGDDLDFLEGSLEDSFKLSRMLYQRVMKIKEKIEAKTKYNVGRIYRSSVERLSFIYGKVQELMKELDDHLLNSYEIWEGERERDNDVGIVDLSDSEESSPGKRDTSTETEKTDISTEADKTDTSTEADKTDTSTEADKTDISTETEKTDTSTETDKTENFSQEEESDVEIVNADAKEHNLAPQRILRSSIKREGDGKPFGNHPPEHVDVSDVSAYDAKRKKSVLAKSRKKLKLSEDEEAMEVTERDPLAVSDTELESNSHAGNGLAVNEYAC